MEEIIYSDDPAITSADAIVIEIPTGIKTKEELLTIYNDVLQEAGMTFGMNWDALYDVLTDMSYLEDIATEIMVVHQDIPLINDKPELASYIEVLGDSLDYHRKKMKRRAPLEVYFPASAEAEINSL
jgi:hypothetical protein